ncbi:hypothetical protein ACIP9H_33360 [Streptomyces sp. NPDC088732]|uniref:hypothetical protein n=1 Tax=Streptomyces sp. NPDC088732 TaxID=3365879 RepID=UPI003814FFC8
MAVSLAKNSPATPEEMDIAPTYRPQLTRQIGMYFVICDDEQYTAPGAAPRRTVIDVVRASGNSAELALQRADIMALPAEHPLTVFETYADTAAQAAGLARADFVAYLAIREAERILFGDFSD